MAVEHSPDTAQPGHFTELRGVGADSPLVEAAPVVFALSRRAPVRRLAAVSELTRILDRVQTGEVKAAEDLLPLVYQELRTLAAAKMAHEAPGQTLQPTALVHEA